jgi:dihydropyrimidine dehydrogenase (NAD+) subunit PreT
MAVVDRFTELRPPLSEQEALIEADRCLDCSGPYAVPPCTAACPAAVDVPRFIRELADGRPLDAARTIYRENLLAGTCSRVCPVEVLCQGACVLEHDKQAPIDIARLQRFATDMAQQHRLPLRERAPKRDRMVTVVGAGPAGLACAGELAARGFDVVVHDEHDEVGGTVRTAIAPYRQRLDPLPAEREALAALGVRFELGSRIESQKELEDLAASSDAVFLGVGLGLDRELGCPGSDLAGVWPSLEFITALKQGHPFELGERVVVLGGGNTAIDVAREAVRLGVPSVTIAYRRERADMPAYDFEVDEAEHEGVQFEWLAVPVEVVGRGRVESIRFERVRPGLEPTGEHFVLAADAVVVAIGQQQRPELGSWSSVGYAELRVHAGGDAANGGASVVQAVAEGKRAARAIEEELCGS